jgi:hypothetical protein
MLATGDSRFNLPQKAQVDIAMPASLEIQAATLEKFIQGWVGWTPDGFLATWSDDCTQRTLPFSFDAPIRDRPHVEHFFPILMSLLSNFKVRETA